MGSRSNEGGYVHQASRSGARDGYVLRFVGFRPLSSALFAENTAKQVAR